ncbi:MAG TPA: FimV/HubP family polar landmark protein [Xanthomonadaceae bacterium]|nr:FimV/HubP family polar landmark protein [Xanthomonadaceae bacterium]
MNGIRKIPLAVALALGAGQAWALGLGALEVRSALNEPLNAEILLTAADAEEIASLKVQLASPEDFERVGLRRGLITVPLEFSVGRNERGQPIIKLTSSTPVRDPFLSVLIDAQWTGGRMLREYTMLLDPPLTAPAVRGTAAAAPARVPETVPSRVEPLPDEPRRPVTEPSRPAVTPSDPVRPAPPTVPTYAADEYGPVAEGETLWVIARNTRPGDDVDINQMMVALQQANPGAFINNNINLLRRGAILRIPSADDVRARSRAEAAQMVARQNEQWRESRGERPLPRIEPSETAAVAATPRREPTPRTEDRLALLPPADDTRPVGETRPGVRAESVEIEGLRADLARTRESLSASEQELREMRSRVRDLESLQSNRERLIELKDAEIAVLQQRLADLQAQIAEEVPDEPVVEDPLALRDPAPDEIPDEAVAADTSAAGDDPLSLFDPPVEATPPVRPETGRPTTVEPAATEPSVPATPVRPAPAPAPWYSSPYVLGGAVVLVAVLVALVARRRRGSTADVESSARGSGSLASRLVAASASGGAAEADELNALQAMVDRDPSRLSSHLALLRHRFEQGDAEGFEADAETMSGYVTDTEAPEWDEVRMMGAELAPEHPLFRDTVAADISSSEPDFADEFHFGDAELDLHSGAAPADSGHVEPEPFSINLGDAAATPASGRAPVEDEFEPTFEPGPVETETRAAPSDAYSTQRFASVDLEDAMGGVAAGSDEGLSLDGGGDDAVATKLDLAREYLDLGDPEGARGLLEEVLKEGSSAQKAEAQRLMVQIR